MRHGSNIDPPNRFASVHQEPDWEHLQWDQEVLDQQGSAEIQYIDDSSQSIVSENESLDIPFRYSLNPYRGCIHGCAYCYARPTHEYLGFSAGLEFETRIIVKRQAADLFRRFLRKPAWDAQTIVFSGVTDCYQPAERKFELTRSCLQIAADCRQPLGVITKNALILRDLDLLRQMSERRLIHVAVSLTTLNQQLARDMEPRTSTPAARLRAIETLAAAGVPVQLMVAPIIPGLNDSEIPAILAAGRKAGALVAGYQVLRLPLTVLPVFEQWLRRTQPLKADAVLSKIRSTRDGQLSDSTFGRRMSGHGVFAQQIKSTFEVFRRKLGYDDQLPPRDASQFCPPLPESGQMRLF